MPELPEVETLKLSLQGKIIDSNNWDATLYGQHQAGGLGSNGFAYLSSIFDTKNKTVIEPTQKLIMDDLLTPFFEIYDNWTGSKWSEFDLGFKTVTPASFGGEVMINKLITKDEGRAILGYPALTDTKQGLEFIDLTKGGQNVSNQPTQ